MSKKCNSCGDTKDESEFYAKRAQCKKCRSDYLKDYNRKNKKRISEQKAEYFQSLDKKKRWISVRKAIQRSPESFVRHLTHHITKKSKFKANATRRSLRRDGYHTIPRANTAIYDVDVDFDYLWGLYQKQGGQCALSGVILSHKFGELFTMSVDRIDSDVGYIRGNVQLVCQGINLAKGRHSNSDVVEWLEVVVSSKSLV